MPVPVILAVIGVTSAVSGVAMGADGIGKIRSANKTIAKAEKISQNAVEIFEKQSKKAISVMDELGEQELKLLSTFDAFSDAVERIQGRPEFEDFNVEKLKIEKVDVKELKKISSGASLLLSGVGGAVAGTAGGFAASGAVTSAVLALGTASTGTAIAELSGAAATNAALAALGGGSIAAGGGGIALGTTALGGMAAGVGLMVGGLVFEITGGKLNSNAEKALEQANKTEEEVAQIVKFYNELTTAADAYGRVMAAIANRYLHSLQRMIEIIDSKTDCNWSRFNDVERASVKNTVLYVGLVYHMCKVKLIKKGNGDLNVVNTEEIKQVISEVGGYLKK